MDPAPAVCRRTHSPLPPDEVHSALGNRTQQVLFTEYVYFFYITNVKGMSTPQIVKSANKRCNQENLIVQLKSLRALHSPVDTLESNWAYMMMASLAWSLKAWYVLMLPVSGRWRTKHEAERARVLKMEPDIPQRLHPPPGADREGRTPDRPPSARLEQVAARLPALAVPRPRPSPTLTNRGPMPRKEEAPHDPTTAGEDRPPPPGATAWLSCRCLRCDRAPVRAGTW